MKFMNEKKGKIWNIHCLYIRKKMIYNLLSLSLTHSNIHNMCNIRRKTFSNLTLLAVGRGKTFCIATTNKTHGKVEREREKQKLALQ
jgi:hypothetical protein